jgi:hypothetical protein
LKSINNLINIICLYFWPVFHPECLELRTLYFQDE